MVAVTIVDHDGTRHELNVPSGNTLMQAAVSNNVRGIVADCGGGLSCATCHCYIDDAWLGKVGGASSDAESQLLECVAAERKSTSRLSCQIKVTDAMEGLVVHLPESQF